MQYNFIEDAGFLIMELSGEIGINNVVDLKKEFQTILAGTENFAVNMAEAKKIDSSGIGIFVNLHKKMLRQKRKLVLFGLNSILKKVFDEMNLEKILTIYESYDDFRADCIQEVRDSIFPKDNYNYGDKLFKTFSVKCPVCQTSGLRGFTLNKSTQNVYFPKDKLVPIFEGRDGNHTIDVFGMQLTSCYRCGFSSRHIGFFSDESGEFKTIMSEKEVLQLNKDEKKRKTIMRKFQMQSPDKFFPPHDAAMMLANYQLAEESTHTLYNVSQRLAIVDLGYYNSILSEIPGTDKKKIYEENAFMWYLQVLKKRYQYSQDTIAEAYYYLIMLSGRLNKLREAEGIWHALEKEIFTTSFSIRFQKAAINYMQEKM